MKCFKVKPSGQDCRYCYPYVDENSPWLSERLYSHEYKEIHELPIRLIVDNDYPPDDFLIAKNIIISKRMNEIIKKLNINLTSFESQMYLNDKKIWDIYYTILLPKYKIFNWEKSNYETAISYVSNNKVLTWIDRLVFDEKKLSKIKEDNFFTMEEQPALVYCTEMGKQAIEEAGLIGIAFEEVPVE